MNIRVVDVPELLPGACFLTNTSDGPFIDTGLDVDDLNPMGRIYIATSTISDLAQHLGFTPPLASAAARNRLAELEQALADALEVNARLIDANQALVAAGYATPERPLMPPPGGRDVVMRWVTAPDEWEDVKARALVAKECEEAEERPDPELLANIADLLAAEPAGTPAPDDDPEPDPEEEDSNADAHPV